MSDFDALLGASTKADSAPEQNVSYDFRDEWHSKFYDAYLETRFGEYDTIECLTFATECLYKALKSYIDRHPEKDMLAADSIISMYSEINNVMSGLPFEYATMADDLSRLHRGNIDHSATFDFKKYFAFVNDMIDRCCN